MAFEGITDERIHQLISIPKRVLNPNARERLIHQNYHKDFTVEGLKEDYRFVLFVRRNRKDPTNFSVGLRWRAPGGLELMLRRYNGSSHRHPPHEYVCHIHTASARAIEEGRSKAEFYAEATERYSTAEGALACLLSDCNISGLRASPDNGDLFGGVLN